MRAWLKGGFMGIIILVILMIIFTPYLGAIVGYPLSIILYKLDLVYPGDPSGHYITGIITLIINPAIISFVFGAIIGLIVQKIKSRKMIK